MKKADILQKFLIHKQSIDELEQVHKLACM